MSALTNCVERLEREGSIGSHCGVGSSSEGLSGSSRSGQRARRTRGAPHNENHEPVACRQTPMPLVGRIAIIDGRCHRVLGGALIEILSEEEEAETSGSSYRSVPLAPVHNLPSEVLRSVSPPAYTE